MKGTSSWVWLVVVAAVCLAVGVAVGRAWQPPPAPVPALPPAAPTEPPMPHVSAASPEAAGRYLVVFCGCNGCHTAGWEESHGKLPEAEWLAGKRVGYRGPWGTTYATNLRHCVHEEFTEDQWVQLFREPEEERPPMPWGNYKQADERDLRAIYRFIKSLGPKGEPEPEFVPPGKEPNTPFVQIVPPKSEK